MRKVFSTIIAAALFASGLNAAEPRPKAFPDKCTCAEEFIIDELAASSYVTKTPAGNTLSPLAMNAAVSGPEAQSSKLKVKSSKKTGQHTNQVGEKVGTYFAWGGDVGASIDFSGNDMSTFDFNISLGLRHGWLNFLGVGAGADISVTNSTRAYPMFMEFRTNFTNRPTICFWQLRLGASYNMLEHNHQQLGAYGTTGLGVNLARNKKFSSHLLLCYTYRQRRRVVGTEMIHEFTDLHYASVKIGVTF